MMYMFQDNRIEPILERKEDIEGQMATYQMRVQEAQAIEREMQQCDEQEMKLRQEIENSDH